MKSAERKTTERKPTEMETMVKMMETVMTMAKAYEELLHRMRTQDAHSVFVCPKCGWTKPN